MVRMSVSAAIGAAALVAAACGGSGKANPAGPSPSSPDLTLRSMTVTSAPAAPSTFQLSARAGWSDGSSRDVTLLSKWESSDTRLAVVSSAGVLSVSGSGTVTVRATYESVTGSIALAVDAPASPFAFALSGVAVEAAPNSRPVPGVRIEVIDGADRGLAETSGADGTFRFPALQPGQATLEALKDGYVLWRVTKLTVDRDRQVDVVLFPIPPKNAAGADATARCRDGSWSWSASRSESCAANGGIAYAVCPGALCELALVR